MCYWAWLGLLQLVHRPSRKRGSQHRLEVRDLREQWWRAVPAWPLCNSAKEESVGITVERCGASGSTSEEGFTADSSGLLDSTGTLQALFKWVWWWYKNIKNWEGGEKEAILNSWELMLFKKGNRIIVPDVALPILIQWWTPNVKWPALEGWGDLCVRMWAWEPSPPRWIFLKVKKRRIRDV